MQVSDYNSRDDLVGNLSNEGERRMLKVQKRREVPAPHENVKSNLLGKISYPINLNAALKSGLVQDAS